MARPWVIGSENVIQWFEDNHTTPYYSIWDKSELKFAWNEDDYEKGLKKLQDTLEMAEAAGFPGSLKIKLHPATGKAGFITKETPFTNNLDFGLISPQVQQMGNVVYPNQDMYKTGKVDRIIQLLEESTKRQNEIESRLAALEMDDMSGAADDGNSWDAIMKGFIKEPAKLQQMIGAVHSVIKMATGQPVPMAGMAGPAMVAGSDEQLLQDAIIRLKKHNDTLGADLQILAKIAETNSFLFNQILAQLRGMTFA